MNQIAVSFRVGVTCSSKKKKKKIGEKPCNQCELFPNVPTTRVRVYVYAVQKMNGPHSGIARTGQSFSGSVYLTGFFLMLILWRGAGAGEFFMFFSFFTVCAFVSDIISRVRRAE